MICDKWVVLKIFEFLGCVSCVVAKRVSDDEAQRVMLLQQKLSREWSLLRSVTWSSLGGSLGDAVYGGYVVITFGLLIGRMAGELPVGRRLTEGFLLGIGFVLFLILGALELAAIDSLTPDLIDNAAVLGAITLLVAALFLFDLGAPKRLKSPASQVAAAKVGNSNDKSKNATPLKERPVVSRPIIADANGTVRVEDKERAAITEMKDEVDKGVTEILSNGAVDKELTRSKYGSVRNGNSRPTSMNEVDEMFQKVDKAKSETQKEWDKDKIRDLSAQSQKMLYERELSKFNERFFKDYGGNRFDPAVDFEKGDYYSGLRVTEDFLPELQMPVFSKVKEAPRRPQQPRPSWTPTLEQVTEYLRGQRPGSGKGRPPADIGAGRDSGNVREGAASPIDPGYVQWAAQHWDDGRPSSRTPRTSPRDP